VSIAVAAKASLVSFMAVSRLGASSIKL